MAVEWSIPQLLSQVTESTRDSYIRGGITLSELREFAKRRRRAASESGKASRKRYVTSEKGQKTLEKWYETTPKGQESRKYHPPKTQKARIGVEKRNIERNIRTSAAAKAVSAGTATAEQKALVERNRQTRKRAWEKKKAALPQSTRGLLRKYNKPFDVKLETAAKNFEWAVERSIKNNPVRAQGWSLMSPASKVEIFYKYLYNQIMPGAHDVGHKIQHIEPRGVLSPENTQVLSREAHKKMTAAERATGSGRLAKIYDEYVRQRDAEKKVGIRDRIKRAVRTGGGVPINPKIRGGILDDPYSVMSWLTKDLT